MTVEELRIGNYVQSEEGTVIQIHGLLKTEGENCIVHNSQGLFSYVDDAFPIPLTVEDFIFYDFTYRELDAGTGYWGKGFFAVFEDEQGNFNFDGLIELNYLHQLQNSYYAFIGTELLE